MSQPSGIISAPNGAQLRADSHQAFLLEEATFHSPHSCVEHRSVPILT